MKKEAKKSIKLVIVESPAKAKTLEKFLGKGYEVLACSGHIRDLPPKRLGVDIENNFEPTYVPIKGKTKIIKALATAAKKSAITLLAPDPDREGEAIAWHLSELLMGAEVKRIEFNEITKEAVQHAVENPRNIDMNRVNAQQARRILDRLVGYKLSPLLWKKVRKGLSAGRVQSVAVELICDREKLILAFIPQEYWSITASLSKQGQEQVFKAKYLTKDIIPNQENADKVLESLKGAQFTVAEVKKKEQRRNPPPPFITSTLQQESARKLGYSARKTMTIAQQLYEGIELQGEGQVGLISYMRTDSVRIANEALTQVRDYIGQRFGQDYLPPNARQFISKKSAQDAHEAIRPTYVTRDPDSLKDSLDSEQLKLYTLIWNRFMACQMSPALLDMTSVDIKANEQVFRASGSVIKFKGFMTLYIETKEETPEGSAAGTEEEALLPELAAGEDLDLKELLPKQHFTEPPPRYTEASLIKELEEKGIGRPSTYAPIISTIVDRGYVDKERKTLKPTELGMLVNDLLVKHFKDIMDIQFTAHMEDDLDDIVAGKNTYVDTLKEFYMPFAQDLEKAYVEMETVKKVIMTEEICPKCGKNLVIRYGRFGEFLACSGFPECKFTKPIMKNIGVKCPMPDCGGEIVERRTKRRKIFYGCSNYPKCTQAFWDKPTSEKCPKCGSLLVEKKTKTKNSLKCSNKECDFLKDA